MEKSLFEQMGGTYRVEGDYLIPNLIALPEKEHFFIGRYGRLRTDYLKKNRRVLYANLLTSGKLNEHLHDVDERATEQINQIVKAFAKADETDEAMKARDQMRWVGLMNNYRHCAEEIVLNDVVYK